MKEPDYTPTVRLIGENGNAFMVMGLVSKALRKAGADDEYVNEYLNKATSGDYDHLLGVSQEYVDVY